MKRFLCIGICLFILVAGCRRAGQEDASSVAGKENYLPLTKGNRWVWLGGLVPAKGDTIIWEVKDRIVRSNGKFAWNIWNKRYWQEKDASIIDSMNIEVEPNLVLMYMDFIDPDADTVLNYPLSEGKKWTVAYIITKHVLRTAQVAGREDVVTPYGKFKDALRIDSQDIKVENDSLVMRTSDWYVPDVGRIMTRIEARGKVWEMRLLSMELH